MVQNKTIHTKHIGDNRYRDLSVYYEKGSVNHWDYSQKSNWSCHGLVPVSFEQCLL